MKPKTLAQVPPTESELRALLGASFAAYQALLAGNADLRPEWKYYGPKSGWTLKLFDRRRNLCFLMPRAGELGVAFALGEAAVKRALDADLPAPLKQEIREARQYVEGRPVRLTVRDAADLALVATLLAIKREK
jgi:hypothetical protein